MSTMSLCRVRCADHPSGVDEGSVLGSGVNPGSDEIRASMGERRLADGPHGGPYGKRSHCCLMALFSMPLLIGLLAADDPSSRAKAMRDVASSVTVSTPDGTKSLLVAEPIYRFADPTRDASDGTTWAYGRAGRPTTLLTISLDKENDGSPRKLLEFTSIAPGPLDVSLPGDAGPELWKPAGPGITLKAVPNAGLPGDDEAKRLRQMKEIVRRFKGNEYYPPKEGARDERYELRLLPQPVHRYKDPASGLIDGAIFFLAYGNNPEVALVVEARREGKAEPAWSHGMNRIAGARVVVSLDDRPVVEWPQVRLVDRVSAYGVVIRRTQAEGD